MDGQVWRHAGSGARAARRWRSACTALLVSGALIAAAPLAASEAPAIGSDVPYPSTQSFPCKSGADIGIDIGYGVARQCAERFGGKLGEYLLFVPQGLFALLEPVTAPWFTAELSSKLTKDAKVCVLKGLVEGIGGTPAEQKAASAAFESYLAIDSAQKFATGLSQGANLFRAAREHGGKHLLQDQALRKDLQDFNKFAFYADKKLTALARNTGKPVDAASSAFDAWFNSAERRSRAAVSAAQQAIDECDFEAARSQLQAAQNDSREWLALVRRDVSRARKQLYCEERRIFGDSRRALDGDSAFAQNTLDEAKRAVQRAEEADRSIVAYMTELSAIAMRFGAEEQAIVARRAGVRKAIDEARAALKSCDLNAAQRHVDALKNALAGNRCNQMTQTGPSAYADTFDFGKPALLEAEISERRANQQREAQEIRAEYDSVMASTPQTTYDCSALNVSADFLERWASEDACRDRLDAAAKATGIRNKAAACLLALEQAPAPPATASTPPSGPAVLTRGEPVSDGTDAQWKTVSDGKLAYESYAGEYIVKGDYTWNSPEVGIGPAGFSISLTVVCTSGPKQGPFSTGIAMTAHNLEIVGTGKPGANGEPGGEVVYHKVEVPIDCPGGKSRNHSLTFKVRPRAGYRYAAGETAALHIGGFWGKEVRYPYTAKGTP